MSRKSDSAERTRTKNTKADSIQDLGADATETGLENLASPYMEMCQKNYHSKATHKQTVFF